ncbi:PLxRFG domain-containing protein [Vibrio parahaemolyticus]|nr:PLxRFG domain-containing protein [Vibrio parahaemolyticus]EJO8600929.1 PLxRFG domain-containing protein [Vibrio parahaemolyticus]EJQ2051471.1 PLxRFG domain-containing protein [Vibrio parahaemolyticus]EJR0886804.1 PLxRFG domain-containing protein [Vibrio parahaemolyticus]
MDFIEARRRVAERERNRNTSTFGDVVDMAQQGALQTLAGAANFVGAEKAASSLENWANEQYETLSPEMREAMAKDIINDDMSFGEGAKDWRTWLGTASNVLGGMAVTMLPAGAAGKAASMAGRSAAVSQGANVGTNALLNLAAGNGGQALNVQREIENIPYHELMDSPQFKRYVAEEADKNISDEEALNNARTRLAQEVGDSIKTDLTLGMVNLIGETVGDQAMVKLLKGSLGKTIKGAIGKGVLAEGGTEAVQGGVEQYRSNVHTNEKMDVEGDNSEGVGAAALESGLVGGLIGGGFGAPSGVAGRYHRRNFETKIEQAINPEVISQLRSVGKTDQEIEALLRPKIENRALSMGFDANESTALAHQALGAAMGKVPPAAERHATEDQAEAQQSVEPQQPEPVQPQQAQPQQPISEAAKQQEQAPVNLFSSDNHADLIRDGQQAVSAIKTWEKQDRGNDYAKLLRQDMSRYLATLNTDLSIEERQAAQRSMNSIYNEFLSAIGQKQKSPVDNEVAQAEMFDPETGEVMADSELYHSQDAQRDKFELSQSIQRGELGFVDEIAAQDENFKQGLQRAMEISPAAVLQIAKARRDGSMSQEQAISALQRVINSEELKQVDQLRPTDEESFLRDQQAQERNAQQQLENRGIRTNGYQPNVEETPEFQRNQARVLQGMRQQAQTNSFAGGHQPNGERDVTPLATGIENQRVYDAPQVEFDRWSDVNPKDVNRDERFTKLANEYDLNPVETEQERYRAPYIVAQEPISASIQEVEQRQPNRNARIQKKFDKHESQEVESYSEELPQTGDEYVYQSGEAAKRSELGRQLGKAQAEIAIKGRQKVNREQRIKNILEGKGTKDDLNWLDKEVNAQADSKKAKKPTLKIGQGIDGVDVKRSGNTTTLTPKVEKWNATIGERSVFVTQDKELKQVQIRLAEQEEPVTTFDYGKGSDMRLMDAIGKANQAADKYVSLIVKSNESYLQSEAEKAQSKGVVDQSLLVEEREKTAKAVDIWPSVEQRLDRGQMPTPEQMNVLQDAAEYINSAGKIYFTGKLGDLLRLGDVLKTRLSKYDALLSDEELEGLDREISDAKKAYQASDNDLSRQRTTARLGRLNKIKDGKGTTEDLKWLRSELESERRGITTPEKPKDVNQTIAKERFAKAKTGKADNPRYQAYLDTLEAEELEAINSNAGYMSWITHRVAEFRDEHGIKKGADLTSSQHKEFDKYLREYADRHLSDRVKSERQKAIDLTKSDLSDDKPKPTQPKASKDTSNETDASKAKKGRSRSSGAREYLKAINTLQSGEYTKEEAIELIDNYIDDVPALEEEFSQFTKPAIGNFFAQMGQWIDTSLRKDDLVKRAVKDIGNQFAAIQSDGGMFVVKSPSAMRNILSEMSDADYNKLAEKRKQQAIEREQEAERKKKALDNPQTLDDFQAYAQANGGTIDAFNDQQLAEFDRLYTENQLSKLAEQEKRELERKAEVKAVETDGTIELSKVDVLNEAKGEQRYGAAFSEVDSDTFNDMRAKAKQLGGWYARAYKPKNLPARFDFKSEQARDDFLSVMGGLNVDQSERVKQRDQEKTKSKKEKQVEALREKAASLQAKADESNNAQRLTNTSRRAAMAASAAARADKQEAQANILRKIADGVESGEFLLLGNLTDISQLEELTSVMNRVKWDMPEDDREKLAYRDQQGNWYLKPETKFNQVARYVRFPAPKSTPASLEYIAREIENLDGYKMTAKSIRANIKGLKEHESVNLNGARWDKVIPKLRQLARSKSNTVYRVEHINELFKSQDRLIRMGIKGDITLRQALREYEQANNGKMSTQKEKTRLQKLTEKIEETVRGNRNAFNDFFPTPEAEVKKLIDLADIKPGMKVLEPSAGMGHIADQIAALNGVDLDVGELAFTLSELLEEKGHNVVAGDFLEYNAGEIYDRIVMNPPFSNDADIHHINHALTMLKDGGKLVAITSSMAGNRGNTTNKNFRRYLDEVGAEEINLDAGAFKNSLNPTNVATKIIVIEKPANDQYDDIRFSKASEVNKKPSTSLSPEKVTQAAQDWINQYDGLKGANVMVVPTMADLHELVETESNAIVKGAWLSGDNRVVLVAENLENVDDVRRTLRHEFVAHNGLYANLDVAQQAQLTKKVNSLRNVNSLKGIFAEVDKSYRTAPEDVKAEEVIAKIAETESSVSQRILDKVLSWVLGALRRSGILSAEKITLSEVRNMINNVDSDLRKPNGMTTLSNVVRFSQTISSMDEDLAQQGDPIVSIADALAAKNESFYKQMLGKINVPFISKQFDALKNGGWALLNLRQMAEVGRKRVSREVGNILESYVNNKDLFTTRKTDLIEKVHKQADALNKFRKDKPQDAEATFSLLHDATLADVDPSKEYVDQTDEKKALLKTLAKLYQEYGGSQTKRGSEIWQERQALEREIKNEPKLRLKHKALREKFLQLSPDAQKVFTDVRDHYISQREEMDKALEERITDLAMAGNKRAGENTYHRYMMEKSRLGFYVPLARFGNYWIDAVDPSGERVFQMYETENAMMKDVKKLQAAGYKVQDDKNANLEVGQVRFGLKIQESRGLNGASASFVSDIIKAISGAQTNDKVKDQLTDEIYQMYLQTMPDRSIRKSFIHRKGVAGYSEDAARVLADQGVRQANQQARLETEKRFTDLMEELKIATDKSNNVSASRLYNEMVKRHEWMMNPQRAQWAQALTGFGFFWQIGISPASAMINLSQNWQIALPYIGSRFGFKETAAEMASLSGLFAKTFIAKKSKAGLRGDMDMTNGILGDVLNQEEREALRHAIKIGAIDVTQMADLTGMAEQESSNYTGKWAKAQQLIGAPFHWAEVMNREVCFITAYRMAKKNGLSKQESLDYATKATWDSHFDYSSRNRARFMQGDVAAVALQFKQYSQNMTYYLFSRFFDSIKGETPEVRKEARKQLLGTFAVTFAIGGLNALPVATIAAIANMAYAVAGDDNEPWDAETELKSLLAKTFGEDIAKGLYYGSMPSVSSRINIDLLRLWVQESDAQDSVGVAENILQQAAGASFGIAVSWARGLDYMTEGQYLRGVEYMTPKWIKDVFRTARYASEGGTVTNRNGEIIIDDVTLFEHAQQALGFTPARLVQQYDTNSALKGYERQVTRRRQSLMNAYWLAVRTKDNDGRKSVLNNIREFNRSEWGRHNPITNEVLSRSVKQHFKMASRSQNGAHYNQKYMKLLQEQQSW